MNLIEGKNSRYCLSCEKLKHFDKFYKCKSCKYGYKAKCKGCAVEVNKKNYQNRKNKLNIIFNNSIERNLPAFRDKLFKSKYCIQCGEYKSYDEYYKHKNHKDGLTYECKKCRKLYRKKYVKENYIKIKEAVVKSKSKRREYFRKKREDENYCLIQNLRIRMNYALSGAKKDKTTKKLLGCTISEFKQHLENQFEEGMTWDNWTLDGWHIDHIIPCDAFDLTNPHAQAVCFHWSNLQPLWAEDNRKKHTKIPDLGIEIDKEWLQNRKIY